MTIAPQTTLKTYSNHLISTGCIFRNEVIRRDSFIYDLDGWSCLTYFTTKYRISASITFGATYIIAGNPQSELGSSRAGLSLSEL